MKVSVAHVSVQGVNCIVFDADHTSRTASGRNQLLTSLTAKARLSGLAVSKSVLAFSEGGRLTFHGTPDLAQYLARNGLPRWTHTLEV